MRILLIGKNGQLGRAFTNLLALKPAKLCALSKSDLDVTAFSELEEQFETFRPDVTINCAAYTDVNRAESESAQAMAVNHRAVKSLASLCGKFQTRLVHFSTDYVFDGAKGLPYVEADSPNPLNVYGESKLRGESAISSSDAPWLVLRTSWVYGEGERNFISKLRTWAKTNKALRIVDDEFSVPTSTVDIAKYTYACIEQELTGLFHLVSSSSTTRYEYALAIKELDPSFPATIEPAKLSEFDSGPQRPAYSVLANGKLAQTLRTEIPHWRDSLERFLSARQQ